MAILRKRGWPRKAVELTNVLLYIQFLFILMNVMVSLAATIVPPIIDEFGVMPRYPLTDQVENSR
jgi:hypothetical protein